MTSASLSISSTTGSVNSPRSPAGSSAVPLAEPPTSKSRSSAMLPTSAVTLLPPESCAERAGLAGGLGGAARRRHRRSRKAPIRTWVRPSPCGNLLHHSRLNSIMHEWPNSGTPVYSFDAKAHVDYWLVHAAACRSSDYSIAVRGCSLGFQQG